MIQKIIKKGCVLVLILTIGLVHAQDKVEKNEFRIKVVKDENGNKTVVDTIFSSHDDLTNFMKENGMDIPEVNEAIYMKNDGDKRVIIRKEDVMSTDVDIEGVDPKDLKELREIIKDKKFEHTEEIRVVIIRKYDIKELSSKEIEEAKLTKKPELELSKLDISPNPTSDELTIKIESENKGAGNLRILDMSGKELYVTNLEKLNAQYQLPIGNLEAGLYIVQVLFEGQVLSKKLVVQ